MLGRAVRISQPPPLFASHHPAADGVCMVLQPVSTTAMGGLGGAYGYGGLANSLGVCIDSYSGTVYVSKCVCTRHARCACTLRLHVAPARCAFTLRVHAVCRPNTYGTAAWTNGALNQLPTYQITQNICDGAVHTVTVAYSRTTGVVSWYVSNGAVVESFSHPIGDLVAILGAPDAYIGYTGATGGSMARQRIYSPVFTPTCPAPATPAGVLVSRVDADTFTFYCAPGYYGASVTLTMSWQDCTVMGAFPPCTPCGAGYYCDGSAGGTARVACPAGTYGALAATTLASPACSGLCSAGYRCPNSGSTSPKAFECGGFGELYCPLGSVTALPVPNNKYSTPLDVPVTQRTWYADCVPGRACVGGLLLDAVSFGTTCVGGSVAATALEVYTSTEFGPTFSITTPGYTGGITWTTSLTNVQAGCNAAASVVMNTATGRLAVNTIPLDFPSCTQGFTVNVRVARSTDSAAFATCAVVVTMAQVGKTPVITNCGVARVVPERSVVGTIITPALAASVSNIGTNLFWSIGGGNTAPFTMDACGGLLRVASTFTWKNAPTFTVPVVVTNAGITPSLTATCNVVVTVQRVNQAPVITSLGFFVDEMSEVGTVVGSLSATDADGDAVSGYIITQHDTPAAFALSPAGVLSVQQNVLNVLTKSIYVLRVNATDGLDSASATIAITLRPVPRPPVTYDQVRSISEAARPGALLSPPVNASHPTGVAFTFVALSPPDVFGIFPNGSVYLRAGATLDYNARAQHQLLFTVQSAEGLTSSSYLTVNVLEINKPPVFCCDRTWNMSIADGSAPGTRVGSGVGSYITLFTATDPNVRDTVSYHATAFDPPQAAAMFTLTALGGEFTVSASAPGGEIKYEPAWVWRIPQTVIVNVSALDTGVPAMWDNGTVYIKIARIRPRMNGGVVTIPANASAGALVASPTCWSPYAGGVTGYALASNDVDTQGRAVFSIHATSGAVTLASHAGQPPSLSYNVRNVLTFTVRCADVNGLTANATWSVYLNHVNQPPRWNTVPRFVAAALTSGTVGAPLAAFAVD
ncbi:hypothetical protein EON62_00715, partial [archaeon]